jgi:beta-galactosidase
VESLDGELEVALLQRGFESAGVPVDRLENLLLVDWRDGFWVATNFSDRPQQVPAGAGARLLIGAREIPPAGVAVWTE